MAEKFRLMLTLDVEQLHILLAQLEGMSSAERNPESLAEEIEKAAAHWKPGDRDNDFDFAIVKIAPLHRQLLDAWIANAAEYENLEARDIIEAENLAEMILALRAARAAVADVPRPKPICR